MKIEAPETRRLRHFLPDQEQRVRVEYDVHFLVAHLRRELRILDEFYRPSRMSKRGHQKAHPSSVLRLGDAITPTTRTPHCSSDCDARIPAASSPIRTTFMPVTKLLTLHQLFRYE
jgi:hypothetical protein